MHIHQFHCLAAAAGDAGQGIVGNDDRQTGFLAQQFVEVAQQCATAGQHEAAFGDVGREFRRRLFQRAFHRLHDRGQRLLQRFQDLVTVQRETARYAFGQVAAAHVDFADDLARVCTANFLLDAFRGRDLITGLPKTIITTTEEVREALEEPIAAIVDAVKVTLDKTPPELAADIMEQGIVLTGGGAELTGIDARLSAETGMPIVIADNPLLSVAIGGGQFLEEFDALKDVLLPPHQH